MLLFGVIFPLVIILIIISLAGTSYGIFQRFEFGDRLEAEKLFRIDLHNDSQIAGLFIENRGPFAKKFILPNYVLCLYDSDGFHPSRNFKGDVFRYEKSRGPSRFLQDGVFRGEELELAPNSKKAFIYSVEGEIYQSDNVQKEYEMLVFAEYESSENEEGASSFFGSENFCSSLKRDDPRIKKEILITGRDSFAPVPCRAAEQIDINEAGKCIDDEGEHPDYCDGGNVVEFYCSEVVVRGISYNIKKCTEFGFKTECPNGCANGACLMPSDSRCTDSDGGINRYVKGESKHIVSDGTINYSVEECSEEYPNVLLESYCDGPLAKSIRINCLNECRDGACIE